MRAAREVKDKGTFTFAADAIPHAEVRAAAAPAPQRLKLEIGHYRLSGQLLRALVMVHSPRLAPAS